MKRRLIPSLLAEKQRAAFVREHEKAAYHVLEMVDYLLCRTPEDGTATPADRNNISAIITTNIMGITFVCEVLYSYTSEAVNLKFFKFSRRALKAPPSK